MTQELAFQQLTQFELRNLPFVGLNSFRDDIDFFDVRPTPSLTAGGAF